MALFAAESEASVQELRDEVRRVLGQLTEECAGRGGGAPGGGGRGSAIRCATSTRAGWPGSSASGPARYSRALLETLALIAYRQPITRGEIEDVRGVGVSTSIMRTLHEREWIRVLSHREAPGRPALYGTTGKFLDDFGLRGVEELPPLDRIRDVTPADLFPAGRVGGDDANGTKEPGVLGAGISGEDARGAPGGPASEDGDSREGGSGRK